MYISCERDTSTSSATGYDRSPGRNTTLSARRSLVLVSLQAPWSEGAKPPTPHKRLHTNQYQYSPSGSCSVSPSHIENFESKVFSPCTFFEAGEKTTQSKGYCSSPHQDVRSLRERNFLLAPTAPRKTSATNLKDTSSCQKGTMVLTRDAASSTVSLSDRGSNDKLAGMRLSPGTPGKEPRSSSPLGLSASPRGASGPGSGAASRPPDRVSSLSRSPTANNIPRSPSIVRSPTVRDMSFLALNSLPSSPAHQHTLLGHTERSHSSSHLSQSTSPFSPYPLHATLPPGTPYHTSPTSRPCSPPHSYHHSDHANSDRRTDLHYLTPILLIGTLLALLSLNVIMPQYNLPWLLLPSNGPPVFSSWLEFFAVLVFLLGLILFVRLSLVSFLVRLPSLTNPWWSALSTSHPFRSTGTVLYRRFSNSGSFGDSGVWTRPLLPTVRMSIRKDGAPPLHTPTASSRPGGGSGGDLATVVVSRVPSSGTMTERRPSSGGGGEGGSLPATPRGGLPSSPLGPGGGAQVMAMQAGSSGRPYETGVHTYGNGDRYEGELKNGKSWGSGVYYFAMTGRYEGEWEENKYHGYGMETWSRGNRYRGQYRSGYRDGYGVYRFYTGDVYAGEWRKGQSFGIGTQTCVDGSRYYGQFQWGVKHGYGKYHFRNGDVYIGEYFGDKMHGYGIYIFANGHKYEGSWHEGRKQGLGLYTFRNGDSRGGFWSRGELALIVSSHATAPVESPVTGGSPVDYKRMMHAVQEARNVAEKVSNLPKVDDKISRAVNQTNRAAIAARVAAVKASQLVSV